MSCIVTFKNKSYVPEEFNAVVKPFYQRVEKELRDSGLKVLSNGQIQGSIHNTPLLNKQMISINNINRKYKPLTIDDTNILKQVDSRKSIWELNINSVAEMLVDSYRRQKTLYGDTRTTLDGAVMYQVMKEKRKNLSPNVKLEEILKNFLTTNGIRVEVYDSISKRLGVDAAGAYNIIERLVLLSKGRDETTLPEETGHVIVETLGNDHALVKSLLTALKKTDYKSLIDNEYLKLYKGNEQKLLNEAAGQVIGKAITKQHNLVGAQSSIKDIIDRIIAKIKKIFNLDTGLLQQQKAEIFKVADTIAEQVLAGNFQIQEKVSDIKPDNPWFYQAKVVDPEVDKDIEVFNLQKKRLKILKNRLKTETDEDKIASIEARIEEYENKLKDYVKSGKRSDLLALSKFTLSNIENLLDNYDSGEIKIEGITGNDLAFIIDALSKFKTHPSLNAKAVELSQRIKPLYQKFITDWVNTHRTDKDNRSWEDIMTQEKDINSFTKNLGALSDTNSVLGSTIGSMIKEMQNKVSRYDKQASEEVQEEIKALKETQASRGVTGDDIYDIFMTEGKQTTYFVGPFNKTYYTDLFAAKKKVASTDEAMIKEGKAWLNTHGTKRGEEVSEEDISPKYRNENYFTIQKTPGLKRFYDFYNKKIGEAFSKLPVERSFNFLPNIAETTLRELIKRNGMSSGIMQNMADFLKVQDYIIDNEERASDLSENNIPLLFLKELDSNKKSKDLGNSLNIFLRFANSHNEMTELLPKLRILEDTLNSKRYISSSSPREISGENSNLSKMVHDYIEMQVKGNMKKDSGKIELPFLDTIDEETGKVKRKYIHLSTIGDRILGYNSLLRIGLNPINAMSNVVIGETANFMESFGGQFFSGKDLTKATSIFTNQTFKEDSKLNKIIEQLNPLQELEDYEALTGTAKKMSKEKLKEYMFILQKKGELFLQVRPMIASMLHDTITDINGKEHSLWEAFDENGKWKEELFGELTDTRINKMSNRIQRINQVIHGRYSSRDAATASQHILVRGAMQFRKWIPSALEVRFASRHFDNRLGEEVEGRWRTLGRLIYEGLSPHKRSYMDMMGSLLRDKKKLESGKHLTPMERANMRKNLIEITLIAGTIVMGYFMLGGDDDKDKIKNPWAKLVAEQLNRISGDLLYFMNPQEYVSLGRNAIPAAKTMGDLYTTLTYIPFMFGGEDAEYKSGPRKGENKFWSKAASSIITAKPITDVGRYFWNEQPYIEPKSR